MRATLDRRQLTAALKVVGPASKGAMAMASLSGVLIEASEAGVDLTCSDLSLTITSTLEAPHSTPGRCLVSCALLTRVVSALNDEIVTLDFADHVLMVTAGEAEFALRCMPADSFPAIPEIDGEPVGFTPAQANDLAKIVPFAALDRSRAELACIQFTDGQAFATDSWRMARVADLPDVGTILVPAEQLRHVLGHADDGMEVVASARRLMLSAGRHTWSLQLVEGKYPDFTRWLRPSSAHRLTVDTGAMAEAIARVQALGSDPTAGIVFQRDGGKLRLASVHDEHGEAGDAISCEGDFDEAFKLNPVFLLQMVEAVMPEPELTLEMEPDFQPVLVRHGRLTMLQMPIKNVGGTK